MEAKAAGIITKPQVDGPCWITEMELENGSRRPASWCRRQSGTKAAMGLAVTKDSDGKLLPERCKRELNLGMIRGNERSGLENELEIDLPRHPWFDDHRRSFGDCPDTRRFKVRPPFAQQSIGP